MDDGVLEEWAGDFLWCFYTISATSRSESLKDVTARVGRRAAARWCSRQPATLALDSASEVARMMCICDGAKRLGVSVDGFEAQIRARAAEYEAAAYFGFDPAVESPPSDLVGECLDCGRVHDRGATRCCCGSPLDRRSRYEVWREALVLTYTGDRFGVTLGTPYLDVIKWLPEMRPYPGYQDGQNAEFVDIAYAVTHVVYTLNDYNRRPLRPEWLPMEFDFLTENLPFLFESGDTELLGEFLDCLRVFGLSDSDATVGSITDYLLANQNSDGSWGDLRDTEIYTRCHSTWTAIDGLRDYDWPTLTASPAAGHGTATALT